MDWVLLLLIGILGGLTTYGMIGLLWFLHDKENK